jgi:uncharacterized secreted protein with C-terminal beta-propeller domain
MNARRPLVVAGLIAALVAPAADAQGASKRVRLKPFTSCGSLIRYAQRHVPVRSVTPMVSPKFAPVTGGEEGGSAPQNQATPAPVSGGEGDDSSTTNVQEVGIDEPDVVKTDGTRIFTATEGRLHVVDARAATPTLLGSLKLPDGWDHQLLLRGERVLVVSQKSESTLLTEVDASSPSSMRVVNTLTVPGRFIDARLIGKAARVVISASPPALDVPPPPGPPRPLPRPGPVPSPPVIVDALSSAAKATTSARKSLRSRAAGWLPSGVLRNRRSGRVRKRALVSCRTVRRAARFSGADMLTVLTIDLDRGLPAVDSDAIMSSGDTVYSSAKTLYVATPDLDDTEIHAFDSSQPGATTYSASGRVPGTLLNQFSLSEHAGVLRAASTTFEDGDTVSRVTTLQQSSRRLVELGHVGELGRGERIFAVRFIDKAGYVVTFRQTDPLFTLDLSDPAHPVKRGELHIPGFSSYLHPVGENLLLGVGRAPSEMGSTGTQLSLFDVSDLSNPVRLQQRTLSSGSGSVAETDHHAFLWWPKTNLAVLPLSEGNFVGSAGFGIQRGGIADAGRLSHPGEPSIDRALVVGDRLFTTSRAGIMVGATDALAPGAWLPLPQG